MSDLSPRETFLEQYRKDQEAGSVRKLSDYLALFPDDQDAIAAEYLALQSPKTSVDMALDAFGPYRLEEELGRGGQGVVYKATDTRIDRTVALKVLRSIGPGADELLLRFKREATAASKTDHPGVCAVYDAEVEGGIPYIAMRYIEGETLAKRIATTRDGADVDIPISVISLGEVDFEDDPDTSADSQTTATSSQSRSEIMRAVYLIEKTARALHAVHEAGVIHRDVKPGNVMITPEGDAVVMDFGLARDEESDLQTLTRTGDFFGTPAYMSPEQLTRHNIRLDRRTDVWALGVMLYECVTLKRPFDAPSREGLYQQILAKEPEAPRRLNPSIPKDLATVIVTALDKDRDRRYQTALDLAEDLRRLRSYEPIVASPMGPMTRLLRWGQRNPAVAAALVLVLLSLSGGLFIALWQKSLTNEALVNVESERTRAEEALTHAEAVKDFLNKDVLGQVSPEGGDKDVLVRDILDKAAQNIEGKLGDSPKIESDIRMTIGTTYRALGRYDHAQPHLERALALRRDLFGGEDPLTLNAMNTLGGLYTLQGKEELALQVLEEAFEGSRRALGEDHKQTLASMSNVGTLYQDQEKYDRALPLLQKTLADRRRTLGEENPETLVSMNNLAGLYEDLGKNDLAASLFKQALDGQRRVLGEDHPHTLGSMNNLGLFYHEQEKYDRARPLLEKAVEICRRALGDEHPFTGVSMHNLGLVYKSEGKHELAVPLFEKVLELRRQLLGNDNQWTLFVQGALVGCLMKQKAHAKVEPILLDLHKRYGKVFGSKHPAVPKSIEYLVDLYTQWGKPEEAAKWKAKLPPAKKADKKTPDKKQANLPVP